MSVKGLQTNDTPFFVCLLFIVSLYILPFSFFFQFFFFFFHSFCFCLFLCFFFFVCVFVFFRKRCQSHQQQHDFCTFQFEIGTTCNKTKQIFKKVGKFLEFAKCKQRLTNENIVFIFEDYYH